MARKLAQAAIDRLASGRDRSARHLLIGLGLTAGAVALSALVARLNAAPEEEWEVYSDYEEAVPVEPSPPSRLFGMVWPPLYLALTISGLRVWNAPRSAARTQALTLWGVVQALNAVWMALGPRRLGGQLATAVASLGTAGAYVWRARRVETPATGLIAPYVGWIGLADVLTEEMWRPKAEPRTVH